ncbi:MAG: hypothetical protein WD907_06465, partial [Bacilli bacterium]
MSYVGSNLHFEIEDLITIQEDQPAVDTFVSMEVKPNLEIRQVGDIVTISGFLHLLGTYRGVEEQEHEELTPFITEEEDLQHQKLPEVSKTVPVSITIPSYRVLEVGDIAAEVESFDYNLNSTRELALNVTLSVSGIQQERETPSYSYDEEEVVFVHRAGHWDIQHESEKPNPSLMEYLREQVTNHEEKVDLEEQEEKEDQEDHPLHENTIEQHFYSQQEEGRPNHIDGEEQQEDKMEEQQYQYQTETLVASTEQEENVLDQSFEQEDDVKVAITKRKQPLETNSSKSLSSFFRKNKGEDISETKKEAKNETEKEKHQPDNRTSNERTHTDKARRNDTPNSLDWKKMLI